MQGAQLVFPRPDRCIVGPLKEVSDAAAGALLKLQNVPGIRGFHDPEGSLHLELPRNCWKLEPTRDLASALGFALVGPRDGRSIVYSNEMPLHEYQFKGLDFIIHNRGVALCDQVGLGKTRQAAFAAMTVAPLRPILILAPKYLKETWKEELLKIEAISDPDEEFCALEGRTRSQAIWKQEARFFFCHYDIVDQWWCWLYPLKLGACIFDEAHFLKNSQTRRAKGAALAGTASDIRIVLTGTPILNRVSEFWNILNLAAGKWSFGTPSEFRKRYAGAYHDGYGLKDSPEPTHTDELKQRIETVYLRRTVHEVGLELPPIHREQIRASLTDKQQARYAEAAKDIRPELLLELLFERSAGRKSIEHLTRLRKLASSFKLPTTKEQIEGAIEEGEDTVCFCWQRKTTEDLIERQHHDLGNLGFWAVHGGLSTEDRTGYLQAFVDAGGLLAATYGALGTGVNLQRARVVILHDLDWTPATLLQAEGRVYRQGQKRAVSSRWIVAEGTLDEFLSAMILEKAEAISQAIDDREAVALEGVLSLRKARDLAEELIERWKRWRS